jgi:hypothetical protein
VRRRAAPAEHARILVVDDEPAVSDLARGEEPQTDEEDVRLDLLVEEVVARGRPGSGLGLAIVRQVATRQRGGIAAEPAPGGGTLMRLRLPGAETLDAGVDAGAASQHAEREREPV